MISEKTSSYENFLSVYQPKAKLKKEKFNTFSINDRKKNKGSHRELGLPVVSPIFVNNYF